MLGGVGVYSAPAPVSHVLLKKFALHRDHTASGWTFWLSRSPSPAMELPSALHASKELEVFSRQASIGATPADTSASEYGLYTSAGVPSISTRSSAPVHHIAESDACQGGMLYSVSPQLHDSESPCFRRGPQRVMGPQRVTQWATEGGSFWKPACSPALCTPVG